MASFASPFKLFKHACGYRDEPAQVGPTTPFTVFMAEGSIMANLNKASADGATVQVNVNDVLASCATDQVMGALPDDALLFLGSEAGLGAIECEIYKRPHLELTNASQHGKCKAKFAPVETAIDLTQEEDKQEDDARSVPSGLTADSNAKTKVKLEMGPEPVGHKKPQVVVSSSRPWTLCKVEVAPGSKTHWIANSNKANRRTAGEQIKEHENIVQNAHSGFEDGSAGDLFKKSIKATRKLSGGQGGGLGSHWAFNHGLKILVDAHSAECGGLDDGKIKLLQDQWNWNAMGRQGNSYRSVGATWTAT